MRPQPNRDTRIQTYVVVLVVACHRCSFCLAFLCVVCDAWCQYRRQPLHQAWGHQSVHTTTVNRGQRCKGRRRSTQDMLPCSALLHHTPTPQRQVRTFVGASEACLCPPSAPAYVLPRHTRGSCMMLGATLCMCTLSAATTSSS